MAALTARTAAWPRMRQCRLWAVLFIEQVGWAPKPLPHLYWQWACRVGSNGM